MTYFMNVLLVAFFIGSFVTGVRGNNVIVQGSDNAEQFALLCRIYDVAKNPPINPVEIQDPLKIVEEIDAINSSFAETKLLNETEHVGNSSYDQVSPTTTRETAVAQAILRRITQKAHTILEKIRKINITEEIEKAKDEFAKVILGEVGSESHLCNGALKDARDRAVACGNPGLSHKGGSAGNNLIVDFFCLCSMRTDDGIQDACGVQVGGTKKNGNYGWEAKCTGTSLTMWASIKKGCGRLRHQHTKSTKDGHEVLRDFLKHLKYGGVYRWADKGGSGPIPGMLGTSSGKNEGDGKGPVCDGKKGNPSPGGICVYYGPESQWENIPWLKTFKTALSSVDIANKQMATIQSATEKLHMLRRRAEEIYEATKVISEIRNPERLAIFHNVTVKRLTAYNAAWRHHHYHFIAPWVLLI